LPVPSHPQSNRPWLLFGLWTAVCCLLFCKPLYALFHLALTNDDASHILIVPFISAWIFYLERQQISSAGFSLRSALPFAILSFILAALAVFGPFSPAVALAGLIFAFLLLLVAGFVASFGFRTFLSHWFALGFLAFLIPVPQFVLDRFIYLLQAGSTDIAETIFDWAGVPALRDGFVFRLPQFSIEVAKECSGIRSSMALLILAILVAHFSFSKFWKKVVFVAAGLLMMIVKNGVRIATLTILANDVNPDFLYGKLHRDGGVVFFLLGLALLLPVYWILRRGERPLTSTPTA
jgi:exosortase